jgi:hypothetical protein
MKPWLLAALLLIGCGLTAHAAEPKPPTAEQIAAAKARANDMIHKAGVSDLFEDASEGGLPRARHMRSGLVCNIDEGPEPGLPVFDSAYPRGDDVACSSHLLGITQTYYATRLGPQVTLDQAMNAVMNDIRSVHGKLEPYKGQVLDISVSQAPGEAPPPPMAVSRFVIKLGGKKVFSKVTVMMLDGWMYEQRVTGPLNDATTADLLAGVGMHAMISEVRKRPGAGSGT